MDPHPIQVDSLLLHELLVLGAARLHIPVREEEQIRKLDQAGDEHLRLLGILDSGELQLQDILDLEEHLGIPDAEGELLLLGILDQVELQPLDILDQVGLQPLGNPDQVELQPLDIPDQVGLQPLDIPDQVELQPLGILDQVGLLLQGNLPVALGILTFFPYVSSTHCHRWSFVNYICV